MNNKSLSAILCGLFLFMGGCSNVTEVRDRVFVHFLGLEQQNDTIKAALSLYGDKSVFYTGQGETVLEAISNAKVEQDKSLFIGHIELLVLKDVNIQHVLEIFTSQNSVSPSCSVVCCDYSIDDLFSDTSSEKLLKTIQTKEKGGAIVQKSIYGTLDQLLGTSGTATVPILQKDGAKMAVIDENGIVSILDNDETQGLCFMQGNIKDMTMPIHIDGKIYNVNINSSKSTLDSDASGGKTTVKIRLSVSGSIAENEFDKDEAKRAAKDEIEKLCRETMTHTAYQLGTDVIGIEKILRKADPDSVPDNREEFSQLLKNINFEYEVDLKL